MCVCVCVCVCVFVCVCMCVCVCACMCLRDYSHLNTLGGSQGADVVCGGCTIDQLLPSLPLVVWLDLTLTMSNGHSWLGSLVSAPVTSPSSPLSSLARENTPPVTDGPPSLSSANSCVEVGGAVVEGEEGGGGDGGVCGGEERGEGGRESEEREGNEMTQDTQNCERTTQLSSQADGAMAEDTLDNSRVEKPTSGKPEENQGGAEATTSAPQERRSKSRSRSPHRLPQPRQGTITSLFTRQLKKAALEKPAVGSAASAGTDEALETPPSKPPPPAPTLSSVDEFLLAGEDEVTFGVEVRELTPLERFQQKVIEQMSCSQRQSGGVGREGMVTGEEGTGEGEKVVEREGGEKVKNVSSPSQLIPENTILKLKDKPGEHMVAKYPLQLCKLSVCCVLPGAIREVWRCQLRRQMSQRLAEEKKAMEERKRFYNEEIEDEEEEAEFTGKTPSPPSLPSLPLSLPPFHPSLLSLPHSLLTSLPPSRPPSLPPSIPYLNLSPLLSDPDTSDNEFIQKEAEEDGESDACSDLDEQEGVAGEGGGEGEGEGQGEEKEIESKEEGDEEGIGEGEEEEEEMDGYSAGGESDGGWFSDNEEVQTFTRSSKKNRLLDSEEEEEEEEGEQNERRSAIPPTKPQSSSCFGPGLLGGAVARPAVLRRSSMFAEEASMGPLVLSESFESEATSSTIPPPMASGVAEGREGAVESQAPLVADPAKSSQVVTEKGPEAAMITDDRAIILPSSLPPSEVKLPEDSGVGRSLEEGEVGESEGEGGEEEEGDTHTEAAPDSDKDNSLESSLLWAQSLVPAQAWSSHLERAGEAGKEEEEEQSQWPGEEGSQRLTDTQPASIDEETQFLDANGYIEISSSSSQLETISPPPTLPLSSLSPSLLSSHPLSLLLPLFPSSPPSPLVQILPPAQAPEAQAPPPGCPAG